MPEPVVPAIRFAGVGKRFPGVAALTDVSFDIASGSCHAICGENGAGKSTLSRILAGIMPTDEGRILLHGRAVQFAEPRDALAAGIAMVHQELAFCDNMSVAENLFLGHLPEKAGFVDRAQLRAQADALLGSIGASIDPDRRVETLSVAQQQLVQIAAAVGSGARVIIFDEPTSSLGEREADQLFSLIAQLRAQGVTLLYISHRMPEIFRLCDHVTVLRDGRHVSTDPTALVDEPTVVQRMIGRELEHHRASDRGSGSHEAVLEVERLTSPARFSDISFALHAGEILGIAGLTGAGRSELAQALFGLDDRATGVVRVRGETLSVGSPGAAMASGIGLVPEDRKRQGLVLAMRSRENITLPVLPRVAHQGWIDRRAECDLADASARGAQANPQVLENPTVTLSGGNQQKIVLAKWLAARSDILILDEPTRGVDVGAKAELHDWIEGLVRDGAAVLLISSELPELLNLSDRILVLREGRLVGEMSRAMANQEALLRLMAGLEAA